MPSDESVEPTRFIEPPDERWNEVLIDRYPNRKAFLHMLSLDHYREALEHRRAALERTRLIPLTVDPRLEERSA